MSLQRPTIKKYITNKVGIFVSLLIFCHCLLVPVILNRHPLEILMKFFQVTGKQVTCKSHLLYKNKKQLNVWIKLLVSKVFKIITPLLHNCIKFSFLARISQGGKTIK